MVLGRLMNHEGCTFTLDIFIILTAPLMLKLLKKCLVILCVTIGLCFALAVILASLFEDKIGSKLLSALNTSLEEPIEVGEINLSLVSGFPNASVSMKHVVTDGKSGGPFLNIGEVTFKMSMLGLLRHEIAVHSITLKNGEITIHRDKKGIYNYEIFKKAQTVSNKTNPDVALKRAGVYNVKLNYSDALKKMHVASLIDQFEVRGKLGLSNGKADVFGEIELSSFEHNGKSSLSNQSVVLDAFMDYNLAKGEVRMTPFNMGMDGNVLQCNGRLTKIKGKWQPDVQFELDRGRLSAILDVMRRFGFELPVSKLNGVLSCNGTLSGPLERPQIKLKYALDQGKLRFKDSKNKLTDIRSQGQLALGKNRESLNVAQFDALFRDHPFHMEVDLKDFGNPRIQAKANGHLPLETLQLLDSNLAKSGIQGLLHIDNWSIKGLLSHVASGRVDKALVHEGGMDIEKSRFRD